MNTHFYVVENGKSTNLQALKVGHIIVELPVKVANLFEYGDGPYSSIADLKNNSPIYQSLKKSDIKRAQQIVEKKNIVTPVKFMFTPKDVEFEQEVVDGFLHAAFGKIKSNQLTGVHYYDPDKVRILEILETNLTTKVFEARFEYFNHKSGQWLKKKTTSTFFPRDWNLSTLIMECKYAFDNLNLNEIKDGKCESFTASKIPVLIIIKNRKLKSIYPKIK